MILCRPIILAQAVLHIIGLVSHLQSHFEMIMRNTINSSIKYRNNNDNMRKQLERLEFDRKAREKSISESESSELGVKTVELVVLELGTDTTHSREESQPEKR